MKIAITFILFTALLTTGNLAAKEIELSSPDKNITLSVQLKDKISYSVSYDGELLLEECYLGMQIGDEYPGENPRLVREKRQQKNENLNPVIPLKNATINDQYNELVLTFKGNYTVEFRAYNDGVAYRFITDNKGEAEVMDEVFSIHFPGDYLVHMQQPGGFKTGYEEPYSHVETSAWKDEDRMAVLPVLIDTKKGYKILISESDLSDYPHMFLKGTGGNGMSAVFPKAPLEFGEDGDRSLKIVKEASYIARTKGKRSYPWRYFVITDDDKKLMETSMTYKLATKNQLEDTSWIEPGQVSWEWWNGATPYGEDVNFVSGYNLDTYKYYIDFASEFGIPYIIMDEGWAKSTRDPYTPNPKVDVHELISYGKEKNVGIVLWLTWLTVENNFELFSVFEEWGVKGVKIDFMDRSDQWMVNFYERVAKEAAKHHLFVDFHGSFKPSGLEYAYPNVLSYEGVRGMEQMGGCTPDNSLYFPFLRNAVGPMDYTPGAMLSMQPESYMSRRPNSASIGTRAYQMALFVVFESGLQMLADNPTLYYRNRECTGFITQVPTVWDETRVLEAKAGEYAIVAKRKDDRWFIGGITNNSERERHFELSLDFLPEDADLTMTAFEDGVNAAHQAMDYRKTEKRVKKDETITVKMVRNGGWAAVIQ